MPCVCVCVFFTNDAQNVYTADRSAMLFKQRLDCSVVLIDWLCVNESVSNQSHAAQLSCNTIIQFWLGDHKA